MKPLLINDCKQNDYAPFGMAMVGRTYSAGSQYRYGFNGKENDKDISEGGQDYGMRISDSRLGRFLTPDPITSKYPELTPYQFASNRPIEGIDLDGLEFLKKDNTNYRMDYRPVANASGVLDGANNVAHNVMSFLWNGTIGAALEGSKSVNNWIADEGYQKPANWDPVNTLNNTTHEMWQYWSKTPNKQIAKDFVASVTDLRNYEMLPSLFVGGEFFKAASVDVNVARTMQNEFSAIGSTGSVGENYLKRLGGASQKYFATEIGEGGRFVDQFVNGAANESKVGYTSLTKDIKMQIAKDMELLQNSAETGVKKIVWNFFESPVTGKVGASKPLQAALKEAGIETQIIKLP